MISVSRVALEDDDVPVLIFAATCKTHLRIFQTGGPGLIYWGGDSSVSSTTGVFPIPTPMDLDDGDEIWAVKPPNVSGNVFHLIAKT